MANEKDLKSLIQHNEQWWYDMIIYYEGYEVWIRTGQTKQVYDFEIVMFA